MARLPFDCGFPWQVAGTRRFTVGVFFKRDSANGNPVPRALAFVGAGVLLVVLLIAMIYTAAQVDAQNPPVADGQLKQVAEVLRTAFTGLLGAVVGLVTGEALSH
jgi:hypothetical protein